MKTIYALIGVVILVAGFLGYTLITQPEPPIGSVSQGSAYHYTQFSGAIATTTLIQTGVTTLGSVVITENFAGALLFLDATSTTAYSIANATQIADMQAALTEGTYTFDVYALKGLVMQSADGFSFAGDITVTWR